MHCFLPFRDYNPRTTKVLGVHWFHSICPSVRLCMVIGLFVSLGTTGWRLVKNSPTNIHVINDCSTVLPLVLGVVTRQKPQNNGSVVLWALTFVLDIYLQGHSTMTLQCNCKNMAHLAMSPLQHVPFWKDSFHIWHKWSQVRGGVSIGQRSRSHESFEFLQLGCSRSFVYNF